MFWARIELQVLRYTPWFSLQRGDARADDYTLDYTEMLLPVLLFQSIKRKHFLVFVTAATTLTLKVQIALSSSIFQTSFIQFPQRIDVQIQDSFQETPKDYEGAQIDSMAYVRAIQRFGLDLPFGVSSECAYQTFKALDSDGNEFNASPEESLVVAVDGLFMDTECLSLEDYAVSVVEPEEPWTNNIMVDLQFQNCAQKIRFPVRRKGYTYYTGNGGGVEFLNGTRQPCTSLPQQNEPSVHISLDFSTSPNDASVGQISCVAALCSSRAWISKVEVVDDGITRKVSPLTKSGSNTTFNIDPMQFLMHSGLVDEIIKSIAVEDVQYEVLLGRESKRVGSPADILTQSRPLSELLHSASKNYTAMAAHFRLRNETEAEAFGTKSTTIARLHANLGVCISMAVVSAACGTFILFVFLYSRQVLTYSYRDPATVLGSIIHICGSPGQYAAKPSSTTFSRETKDTQKEAWSQGAHVPLVLASTSRVILVLYILGLILGLSLSLQRSQDNSGLLTEAGSWSLIFQLLPVLSMLAVSLYSNSSDIAMRSLAILDVLSNTSAQPSGPAKLDISLLDMIGARVLYLSIRLRVPAITITQLLGAICGFLPIIGSVLLRQEYIPMTTNIALKEQSWFGSRMITRDNFAKFSEDRETINYLSLFERISNLTYPQHTYLDLIFPSFYVSDPNWVLGATAKVRTPAAKLSPSCRRVSEDEFIIFNKTIPQDEAFPEVEGWETQLVQHVNCHNNIRRNVSLPLLSGPFTAERDSEYFGISLASYRNPGVRSVACSDAHPNRTNPSWLIQTYAWGEYSQMNSEFDDLFVWECNYTWVNVATEVNLHWSDGDGNFQIDHNNPPAQDESSVRPWTPPFGIPVFDDTMLELAFEDITSESRTLPWLPSVFEAPLALTPDHHPGVQRQFVHILEPYGPITSKDLGDQKREDRVLEALHSKLAFAAAQLATIEQRLDLDERSDSDPLTLSQHSKKPITRATVSNTRLRVIQSSSITFTLITILSFVAAVHTWALVSKGWRRFLEPSSVRRPWLLDLELRGVAPPGFSSVAMMASLLDGSNCSSILPENAHLMAPEDLYRHLAGREFRLGWFYNMETDMNVYTIGVLNEGPLVFKGSKFS